MNCRSTPFICRYWSHPHEQCAVYGQGEVNYRLSLQTGAAVHLQTHPGCSGPLQRPQHRLAGHGEKRLRSCIHIQRWTFRIIQKTRSPPFTFRCVWQEVEIQQKAVWRCWWRSEGWGAGALSAVRTGASMRPWWSVDSWAWVSPQEPIR